MSKTATIGKIDSARISISSLSTLNVMMAMTGHVVSGQSNAELSTALSMTPSMVNRCLNTLIHAGLARKLDNNRFALTSRFVAFARAVDQQMDAARTRLDEMEQNIRAISRGLC